MNFKKCQSLKSSLEPGKRLFVDYSNNFIVLRKSGNNGVLSSILNMREESICLPLRGISESDTVVPFLTANFQMRKNSKVFTLTN